MKDALEKLSIPIVLLGSLWAAVGIVLQAFKVINERRDYALKLVGECGACTEKVLTPAIVYWTNMVPLTTGLVLFLVVVTVLMLRIPRFVQLGDPEFETKMVFASRLLAAPLVFTIIGFVAGGAFDFYYLFVLRKIG